MSSVGIKALLCWRLKWGRLELCFPPTSHKIETTAVFLDSFLFDSHAAQFTFQTRLRFLEFHTIIKNGENGHF